MKQNDENIGINMTKRTIKSHNSKLWGILDGLDQRYTILRGTRRDINQNHMSLIRFEISFNMLRKLREIITFES
ncbi:hypothetical protein PVK06_010000 [Gossypium arboreum]|uniref:Uncharacterized protein n=1 Tax=Gossypium arboreum TaxID=29729 RepID=A0ABR0QP52_GOSAR|nr:hypothetical protein PVK06_010000 [Gossypium arboreum]